MASRLVPKPVAPQADPSALGWNSHPSHVTVLWSELLGLFRGETIAPQIVHPGSFVLVRRCPRELCS